MRSKLKSDQSENMKPFSVEVTNQVGLYQLSDGRYQLTQKGPVDPIMIGHGYLLVNDEIAEELRVLIDAGVAYEPATIWDRTSNIKHKNYQILRVTKRFSPDQINDLDISEDRFLIMDNQYLFVTPSLKIKLEKSSIELTFFKGLNRFG